MKTNEEGEYIDEHHTHYKEIDGFDRTVLMTRSEHTKLHKKLRREGKCNIPPRELKRITNAAHNRTDKTKKYQREYRTSHLEELKIYHEKYREENRDRLNEQKKDYYKENRIEISDRGKKHYQENKEEKKAKAREYYQKNKERIKAQKMKHHNEKKMKNRQVSE